MVSNSILLLASCLAMMGLLATVVLVLVGVAALGGRFIRGSGNLIAESRDVDGFRRVVLGGTGQLVVTQGEATSLSVETDDNVLPYVVTDVRGDALHLGLQSGWGRSIHPSRLQYNLVVVDLRELDVSGSGHADVADLATERLAVHVSGSGSVRIGALAAQEVRVRISGSGKVELAGAVPAQDVGISGSGHYRAAGLRSVTARIGISGSGNATVWATDSLSAHISGSGSVHYYENPQISVSSSGSGKITSLGPKQKG